MSDLETNNGETNSTSEQGSTEDAASVETPPNPLVEMWRPLVDFAKSPRAMWGVNVPYLFEGFVYFGMLGYLAMYFSEYGHLADLQAGWMVTFLTAGITLSSFIMGGLTDKYGVRRTLLVALVFMFFGRAILAGAPMLGLSTAGAQEGLLSPFNVLAMAGLFLIVTGYGTWLPAAYSSVKKFTTPKTAAMGYAMLYALMNLGGWLPSFFSPVRKAIGISGAYWVYTGVTVITLVVLWLILKPKVVAAALAKAGRDAANEGESAPESRPSVGVSPEPAVKTSFYRLTIKEKLVRWAKQHPLSDARFTFFIFALIPVQTLFAHNWLTLPMYVERAFRGSVIGENFEVAVNLNPLLIFLLVPLVTNFTFRRKTYNMMLAGTFVMAAPTFFLALGPSPITLFSYLLIMTIGEAMWQPRFLQYAAEIAPEGKTGAYMGVAQLPWFLTKVITGLYSGFFLAEYCPKEGELNTEMMWLIYAGIAMMSFVMLVVARRWMVVKKS